MFEEAAWTDDTDQSLLILMSFLHSGGKQDIDHLDFAKRLKVSDQHCQCPRLNDLYSNGFNLDSGLWIDCRLGWAGPWVRSCGTRPSWRIHWQGLPCEFPPQFRCCPNQGCRIWEQGNRHMAANGAIMRTPVVGALLFKNQEKLYSSAINLAHVTHADPRCLVSCTIASALVAAVRISSAT
jgi:hypothetical protein